MSKHVKINSPRHESRNIIPVLGGIGIIELLMIMIALILSLVFVLITLEKVISPFICTMLIFFDAVIVVLAVKSNNKTKVKGWEYVVMIPKNLFSKNKFSSRSWNKSLNKKFEVEGSETIENVYQVNKQFILGYHIDGKNLNALTSSGAKKEISNFNKLIKNGPKRISIFKINEELDLDIVVDKLKNTFDNSKNEKVKEAVKDNINTLESIEIKNSRYIMLLTFKNKDRAIERSKEIDKLVLEETSFAQSKINNKDMDKIMNYITLSEEDAKYEILNNYIKKKTNSEKKYYSYVYISEYEKLFNTGWLSRAFNSHDYMVCMNTIKIKDDLIVDEINKEIKRNDAYIAESNNDFEIEHKKKVNRLLHEEASNIRNNVSSINELGIVIRIEADTKRSANHKFMKLRNDLAKDGLTLSLLKFNQLEAAKYVAPGQTNNKIQINEKIQSEVTSSFISTSWPFMNDSLFDDEGIIIGDIEAEEKLNLIDFNTRRNTRVNSNMFILASSGSGKTMLTLTILDNRIKNGEKIFIIDPENEYREFAEYYGGTVIDFSTGENKINVLQVIPSGEDVAEEERDSIIEHLSFLSSFFINLFPTITPMQLSKMKEYILETYKSKKITEKQVNESYDKVKWPTFSDVLKTYEKLKIKEHEVVRADIEIVGVYLKELTVGSYSKQWNCQTKLDIESDLVVFDISRYVENAVVASSLMNIISKIVWQKMNEIYEDNKNKPKDQQQYSALIVDEAHLLMKKSNMESLEWLTQVVKRIRKRNGSVTIISQNVSDFLGDKEIKHLSSRIINNCTYSLIGQLKESDLNDLNELYKSSGGLNEHELDFISSARSFQFVLSIGQEKKVYLKNTRPNILNKKPLKWRDQ